MLQMVKDDARQMIMGATFTFKTFIDKPENHHANRKFLRHPWCRCRSDRNQVKAGFVFDDERIPLIQPRYESTT